MSRAAGSPVETVIDALARHARERPAAPVFVSPRRTATFADLRRCVSGCSGWLRDEGIEAGERVGVTVADEFLHLIVALALAAAGAAHVALPTYDGASARARLASRIGVRRLIAVHDEHRLPQVETLLLDPLRESEWMRGASGPLRVPGPTSLLTFFTTSGTTGDAKIIPVRHDDFTLQAGRARVGRVLTLASVEHAIAKRQFLYAVFAGTGVASRGTSDLPVARLCAELGVDIIASNAARARELMGEAPRHGRLPAGTELTAAGSRTSAAFRRQLLAEVCDAVQITYSMQECGSIARAIERGAAEATDTVGMPHAGVEAEVVGPDDEVLPAGEAGEIRIRAPGMARGYLDDDAANARHFRGGWFRPGDLASFTASGALVIHGRADDVMILNGIKIAPLEIERALEGHPAVKAVVAFPVRSPVHGEMPIAAVELAEGARADERELRRFARDALGMRAPRRVMIVPTLPTTAENKVDVKRLAALASARDPDPAS